ncbi:conserved hypothetical protein [gamma proteobacterium NOR5-3]|nr:conserved hypothetical protein [gamma proteobacterium NOR5-3]
MDTYSLIKLIHLLGFCYWLGGDIGVFYSSGFVVRDDLSREQRLMAGRIMLALDLIPRICMSITLTVAALLASQLKLALAPGELFILILLGPLWLALVLVLHFRHAAASGILVSVDKLLRWTVIGAILIYVANAWFADELAPPPWLLLKLLGFAVLVFLGLLIRAGFGGFAAGYAALLKDHPDALENAAMQSSLSRVRPLVLAIWTILIFEAYLGIAKPYW